MILDLVDFKRQIILSFGQFWSLNLRLPGMGLNFCIQRIKRVSEKHFCFQNLKWLKIKTKHIEQLPQFICFMWLQGVTNAK